MIWSLVTSWEKKVSRDRHGYGIKCDAYVDLEVSVKQHLELERLLALVADVQHGLQAILAEGHCVDETKLIGPGLLVLSGKVGSAEAEVKLDRIVAALGECARLRRGAAQVLPGAVASEAVLREGAGGVVLGRRAECL